MLSKHPALFCAVTEEKTKGGGGGSGGVWVSWGVIGGVNVGW